MTKLIIATCKKCKFYEKQVDTKEQAKNYVCIVCRRKEESK